MSGGNGVYFMKAKFNKQEFKSAVENNVKVLFRKELSEATDQQLFQAISSVVKEWVVDDWIDTHKKIEEQDAKKLYYFSMEFL